MTEQEVKDLIQQAVEPIKAELEKLYIQLDRQATEIQVLKEGGNI